MDYSEFIKKQNNIYSEFRDLSKVKKEGLIPKIEGGKGGYIIALRPSNNIVDVQVSIVLELII